MPRIKAVKKTPVAAGRIKCSTDIVTALVSSNYQYVELTFPSLEAALAVKRELNGLIEWMERTG